MQPGKFKREEDPNITKKKWRRMGRLHRKVTSETNILNIHIRILKEHVESVVCTVGYTSTPDVMSPRSINMC
eukprot:m.33525 g.33525  ORF g.33525 m.33525 type:complete len:72 (-) comp16832_c0_seq1:1281-1496(-)